MSKPKATLAKKEEKKERNCRRNHVRKHILLWVKMDSVILWLFTVQIRSVSDFTETLSSIEHTKVFAVLSGAALNLIFHHFPWPLWAVLKHSSVLVHGWAVGVSQYIQKRYPLLPSSQPCPNLYFLLSGRGGLNECIMTPIDHKVRIQKVGHSENSMNSLIYHSFTKSMADTNGLRHSAVWRSCCSQHKVSSDI